MHFLSTLIMIRRRYLDRGGYTTQRVLICDPSRHGMVRFSCGIDWRTERSWQPHRSATSRACENSWVAATRSRISFAYFLFPGVHHGGGGPGLTEFDSFSALEDWVEKGQVPDKLIAGRMNNGQVERTRPIYPYPVRARYSGAGNAKTAESFVPFDPTTPLMLTKHANHR